MSHHATHQSPIPDDLDPAGVFAPAHLGELTRIVPPEMINAVLADTGATQKRIRRLPSRLIVYLVLAGALFADQGWTGVWDRLTAGLRLPVARPARSAISQALRRVGPAPLEALFRILAGPGAVLHVQQIHCAGRLVTAIDGTQIPIPDTEANRVLYPRHKAGRNSEVGYPMIRMLGLVAAGTRQFLDAAWGPDTISENAYATRLAASMGPGMLVLADRNFASINLYTTITATGADFLIRGKTTGSALKLPVLERLTDGSFLSRAGQVQVRVIDARITATPTDEAGHPIPGRTTTRHYRLITSLLDPHQAGAPELIRLYHQRWQIETAFCEVKSVIGDGRVLRSRDPAGVAQEVWGRLALHQILRTAMSDAILQRPDLHTGRLSITTALRAARDQVIAAHAAITTTIDLVGHIGAAILTDLIPIRGPRTRPRVLKRATSKYHSRTSTTDYKTYPVTLHATILTTTTDP